MGLKRQFTIAADSDEGAHLIRIPPIYGIETEKALPFFIACPFYLIRISPI